jgi:hypothetical protein
VAIAELTTAELTTDEYCREIEAYLCRKNDGHLIRIVGPSFERVCGWAAQGIPFRIVCQGIDRYFIRYYAKGSRRRRPVQIDFCEADVLDAFDAWRRAVGVRLPGTDSTAEDAARKQRNRSLGDHLERVGERVIARRAGMESLPPDFERVLEQITGEIGTFKELPSPVRGETRARVIARLSELDRDMLKAVRALAEPASLQALREEAADQLRPFRDRLPPEAYERALEAAVDRLLRDGEKLPTIAFG